jgi:CRP/FNR family transcriptional regulator
MNLTTPKNWSPDLDLLRVYGAISVRIAKGEHIFREGETPRFYFQLISGTVRLYNQVDDGKEITQGIFHAGQCFGEPPLLIDKVYPASAQACRDSVVIKLAKPKFMQMMHDDPVLYQQMLQLLAERIYQKSIATRRNALKDPEERIYAFIEHCALGEQRPFMLPFTRQEVANFTGLRVETVIRAIGRLVEKGRLEMRNRKIYL